MATVDGHIEDLLTFLHYGLGILVTMGAYSDLRCRFTVQSSPEVSYKNGLWLWSTPPGISK